MGARFCIREITESKKGYDCYKDLSGLYQSVLEGVPNHLRPGRQP